MVQNPLRLLPCGVSCAILGAAAIAATSLGSLLGMPGSGGISAAAARSLASDTTMMATLFAMGPRRDVMVSTLGTQPVGPTAPTVGQVAAHAVGGLAPRTAGLAQRPTDQADDLLRILQAGRFAYQEVVARAAARHAVDRRLVLAIIALESRGDPAAVSQAGAIGLMQLMPATAQALGVDPWNPAENVEGAVRYLASLLATFRSVDLSLVAYNAGPTFAARYRAGEVDLDAETRAFLTGVRQLLH